MPTLSRLLRFISQRVELPESIGDEIRREWPRERVYIPPANSRRDPKRKAAICEATKRLPVRVVAQRFGVTESYVCRVIRKK